MQFRSLGASGLKVPVLALSLAKVLGSADRKTAMDQRIAARLIDIAIEQDARLFTVCDAAPSAQTELARIIGKRRSQVLIAAQVGRYNHSGDFFHSSSRPNLISACEQTLQRLSTDYLDLLLVQNFDPQIPLEESLSALGSLIGSGKVRYIGCGGFAAWQVMKALAVSERNSWPRFIAQQFAYSLITRDCERELLPMAADQNVGAMVYGGLAGGILAGNYGRSGIVSALADQRSGHSTALSSRRVSAIIDCLEEIAQETGCSKAQIALTWLLQRPTVSSIAVGASCAEQLEANLAALDMRLADDQMARLEMASDQPYPVAAIRSGEQALYQPYSLTG